VAAGLAPAARAYIPEHNWEKYDWGSGPEVKDRLYQGPFPQYPPAAVVPDSDVVMVTTPSKDIVPNYGMGLVVYVSGDTGPPRLPGETLEKSLEDLFARTGPARLPQSLRGLRCVGSTLESVYSAPQIRCHLTMFAGPPPCGA